MCVCVCVCVYTLYAYKAMQCLICNHTNFKINTEPDWKPVQGVQIWIDMLICPDSAQDPIAAEFCTYCSLLRLVLGTPAKAALQYNLSEKKQKY